MLDSVRSHQKREQTTSFSWMACFYVVSGICVLLFMIHILGTFVLRLKVETAVVSAQMETMVAPLNGLISAIFVEEGAVVAKGTPLMTIDNIELERAAQLAQVEIEKATFEIHYYQTLLNNEQQRLNLYKQIGHHRARSAHAVVNMAEQSVEAAQVKLNRLTLLYQKHYISQAVWQDQQRQYQTALEKLKRATALQQLEHRALRATDQGLYFTGAKLEGIQQDLKAKLNAAKKRLTLSHHQAKIYQSLKQKLILTAPFEGHITRILKSSGNTTNTSQPLLLIEKAQVHKTIVAYVTQQEMNHIGWSKKVSVYLPALDQFYHAQIIEMNRTEGFVDLMHAQYRWRDLEWDRSAKVTLEIQSNEQKQFDEQALAGLPAIVYFSRRHS